MALSQQKKQNKTKQFKLKKANLQKTMLKNSSYTIILWLNCKDLFGIELINILIKVNNQPKKHSICNLNS